MGTQRITAPDGRFTYVPSSIPDEEKVALLEAQRQDEDRRFNEQAMKGGTWQAAASMLQRMYPSQPEVESTMPVSFGGAEAAFLGQAGVTHLQNMQQRSNESMLAQKMQHRENLVAQIEAEKDRAQQIKLEMARQKNRENIAKMDIEARRKLAEYENQMEIEREKARGQDLQRFTDAAGNPYSWNEQTGEVQRLNTPPGFVTRPVGGTGGPEMPKIIPVEGRDMVWGDDGLLHPAESLMSPDAIAAVKAAQVVEAEPPEMVNTGLSVDFVWDKATGQLVPPPLSGNAMEAWKAKLAKDLGEPDTNFEVTTITGADGMQHVVTYRADPKTGEPVVGGTKSTGVRVKDPNTEKGINTRPTRAQAVEQLGYKDKPLGKYENLRVTLFMLSGEIPPDPRTIWDTNSAEDDSKVLQDWIDSFRERAQQTAKSQYQTYSDPGDIPEGSFGFYDGVLYQRNGPNDFDEVRLN